ncbi:MAG: YfiR family protein [Candidatus Acidiferrum sp.]
MSGPRFMPHPNHNFGFFVSTWSFLRRLHTIHFAAKLIGAMACLFSSAALLFSQPQKPSEYQVKATYLYNFGRFVKWPDSAPAGKGDSFSVCVLGQDPFGAILDSTLAGESLDGKPVVLRRFSKPQDAADCRILFISSNEEKHLDEILTALDENGVLTVSDMPGFTRRGGMIQFVLEGDRVRFEINLASAESARLTLSSELLKVAASVKRSARGGD